MSRFTKFTTVFVQCISYNYEWTQVHNIKQLLKLLQKIRRIKPTAIIVRNYTDATGHRRNQMFDYLHFLLEFATQCTRALKLESAEEKRRAIEENPYDPMWK